MEWTKIIRRSGPWLCRGRFGAIVAVLLGGALLSSWLLAAGEKLARPIEISLQKIDKTPLHGVVSAWDDKGFDFTPKDGDAGRVAWSELDAHGIYIVRGLMAGPQDGARWVELGHDLMSVSGGSDWANRAFERALAIDPKLAPRVEQLRGPTSDASAPATRPTVEVPGSGGTTAAGASPSGDNTTGGPRVVGAADQQFWGKLTDKQQAQSLDQLRRFADGIKQELKLPLKMQETKFFLFCSDLPATEASKWAGLLDKMYGRLADLFAVPRGQNLWRGKGLIFVFSSADDYRRYEVEIQNTDPGESAGMTHCFGNGIVTIAFYRQPDERLFAHVLVHESVHGFLHRYRSPVTVPSWANEGLAETIASELVPDDRRTKRTPALARRMISLHSGNLGNFFKLEHIEGWHYPVAETLTTLMIQNNRRGYVDFINGIKSGQSWKQSLEQNYKTPIDALIKAYSQSIGTTVTLVDGSY